jgi:hypothetical protein
MMIVYAVIGYDRYYPCPDNVEKVFASYERATEYLEALQKTGRRDYYDVVEYMVEN